MRIYQHFAEAYSEIQRDLAEMGIRLHPKTYQDQHVEHDPGFDMLELQNYAYTILNPDPTAINTTQPWANAEWEERVEGINGKPVNPGEAYKLRANVWETFLHQNPDSPALFAYTYAERFANCSQVRYVLEALQNDQDSRQGWISMWQSYDSMSLGGKSRVPCSLGWQLQIRGGSLHIHYIQRSADFVTHFQNDVFMSMMLHRYCAKQLGVPVGRYAHTIFSMHMFKKDAEGVF